MFVKQFWLIRVAGRVLWAAAVLPLAGGAAQAAAAAAAAAASSAASSAAASSAAAAAAGGHGVDTAKPRIDLAPPADATDFTASFSHQLNEVYDEYLAFKSSLQDDYNISFALPVSIYGQWAAPKGGPGTAEVVYSPLFNWTPFTDTAIGSGAVDILLQSTQFWTRATTGSRLANMRTITQVNAWGADEYQVAQMTYTHTFPGKYLSIAVGQYNFGQYDDNQYSGDAQSTFINYALAQNGTQAYTNAGLGAYTQINPTDWLQLAGGAQSATDITGHALTTNGLGDNKIAWFVAAQVTANLLAGGTYNIIYYNQPEVPQQPAATHGISFSASQDIDDTFGLFVRANTVSGLALPIQSSVAVGGIVNNPFGRLRLDQFGIAVAWDKANKPAIGSPLRNAEWIGEIYYNYWVFKGLFITPDVQVYISPVLDPKTSIASVFTLRTTFEF